MGLLSGDVDVFINDASTTVENIRAGKCARWRTACRNAPRFCRRADFAELGLPAVVSCRGSDSPPRGHARRHRPSACGRHAAGLSSPGYQARLDSFGLAQIHAECRAGGRIHQGRSSTNGAKLRGRRDSGGLGRARSGLGLSLACQPVKAMIAMTGCRRRPSAAVLSARNAYAKHRLRLSRIDA